VASPAKNKPDKANNIVAVVGGDEGAVKAAAMELAGRMTPPDAGEFGVEIIDGNVDNAAAAVVRKRFRFLAAANSSGSRASIFWPIA
jgi:ethanolamine utilization microcompartment shell protein EutL